FGLDIDRSYPPLGSRTLREVGADAAIRPCKLRVDEIITAPVYHLFPARAFTSCRTNYFLPIPIDLKVRDVKTIPLYLLPTAIILRRADQINGIPSERRLDNVLGVSSQRDTVGEFSLRRVGSLNSTG